MSKGCSETDCKCKFPPMGGLIKCSNCGNKICERENFEDYCNCPEDCSILKHGLKKTNSKKITVDTTYYEQFKKKCDDNGCCLKSLERAEKQNSKIFSSMSSADCPSGYSLNMLKCRGSYVWCYKR